MILCKKYDNIYVDTAISYSFEGAIEYMVSKVGAEKILYGSDMAFFDCRQTIGKIGLAKISESDKVKIFGENAKCIIIFNHFIIIGQKNQVCGQKCARKT